MALSAELDQLAREFATSQSLTCELKSENEVLRAENAAQKLELERLENDGCTMLQTITSLHKAFREDLQLSAAYSDSVQAHSNCKAQLLESACSYDAKIRELSEHLLQSSQNVAALESTATSLKTIAEQAKAEQEHHVQELQSKHVKEVLSLHTQLSRMKHQLQHKVTECHAKTTNIVNDQKTTNMLKSKLASMRTDIQQLQQDRDRLKAQLGR